MSNGRLQKTVFGQTSTSPISTFAARSLVDMAIECLATFVSPFTRAAFQSDGAEITRRFARSSVFLAGYTDTRNVKDGRANRRSHSDPSLCPCYFDGADCFPDGERTSTRRGHATMHGTRFDGQAQAVSNRSATGGSSV